MTRLLAAVAALGLGGAPALADGYLIGAGRWTCEKVVQVAETGTPSEKGQLFGWMMGYWSFSTTLGPKAFIDVVERAGGEQIANLTVAECRKAPQQALFRITDSLIQNTRAGR